MPITMSCCLIASIYFFCVPDLGTMNFLFDATGILLRKNSPLQHSRRVPRCAARCRPPRRPSPRNSRRCTSATLSRWLSNSTNMARGKSRELNRSVTDSTLHSSGQVSVAIPRKRGPAHLRLLTSHSPRHRAKLTFASSGLNSHAFYSRQG